MNWEEPVGDIIAEQSHVQYPAITDNTASPSNNPNSTINLISDDTIPATGTEPSTSGGHTRSMIKQLEGL